MLECRAVSFTFPGQGQPLLEQVELSLRAGEFCVLLGHNGSGKSTLCRLLSGLYLPSRGSIALDGLSTAAFADASALRRLVQFVGADPDYQTIGQTVVEDITFGLRNFGFAGQQLAQRLAWALDTFGLAALRDRPVTDLSGGELQLLVLAGAVAVGPRYLILDEAVAMLDPATRRHALDSLRVEQEHQRLGVLLATHDLDDLAWADRVCWLDAGKLRLDAPRGAALEALADHPGQPFDLPAVTEAARRLRAAGWSVPLALSSDALVEAVCASTC